MAETRQPITVFAVTKREDTSTIVAIFSSAKKVFKFLEDNPYQGFIISDHVLDDRAPTDVVVTESILQKEQKDA